MEEVTVSRSAGFPTAEGRDVATVLQSAHLAGDPNMRLGPLLGIFVERGHAKRNVLAATFVRNELTPANTAEVAPFPRGRLVRAEKALALKPLEVDRPTDLTDADVLNAAECALRHVLHERERLAVPPCLT